MATTAISSSDNANRRERLNQRSTHRPVMGVKILIASTHSCVEQQPALAAPDDVAEYRLDAGYTDACLGGWSHEIAEVHSSHVTVETVHLPLPAFSFSANKARWVFVILHQTPRAVVGARRPLRRVSIQHRTPKSSGRSSMPPPTCFLGAHGTVRSGTEEAESTCVVGGPVRWKTNLIFAAPRDWLVAKYG